MKCAQTKRPGAYLPGLRFCADEGVLNLNSQQMSVSVKTCVAITMQQ
jgi:hypothetical protein